MLRKVCLALLSSAVLSAQIPANLPPFSTFLKASSTVKQVAVDAQGYIYVYGETNASPATGQPQSVYVARLDPTAANLTWIAQLGGSGTVRGAALAVDSAGNAYVTGYTYAPDFTTLPPA